MRTAPCDYVSQITVTRQPSHARRAQPTARDSQLKRPGFLVDDQPASAMVMNPRRESSIAPVAPARRKTGADPRMVVVVTGTLGGLLILALMLTREHGLMQLSAPSESAPPRAAAGNLSAVDEPARAPTYPIPPEVIAKLRSHQTASAPTESNSPPANESKHAAAAPSRARDHAPPRRVALAPRGESRIGNTRGAAPTSPPPPSSSAAIARSPPADHTAMPASSPSSPATEARKRVPLIDDQPRVRILE